MENLHRISLRVVDCVHKERKGGAYVESSWNGNDECDRPSVVAGPTSKRTAP
jgi:hypothetical protein